MAETTDWKSLADQWDNLPLDMRQAYLLKHLVTAVEGQIGKELNVLQWSHSRGFDTIEEVQRNRHIPNEEHMLVIRIGLCHHTVEEGVCTKCGWPWPKDKENG